MVHVNLFIKCLLDIKLDKCGFGIKKMYPAGILISRQGIGSGGGGGGAGGASAPSVSFCGVA